MATNKSNFGNTYSTYILLITHRYFKNVTLCIMIIAGFVQGGVIGVFINWKCNLDIDSSNCKPTYAFRRLDLRKDQANTGYYYRQASKPDYYSSTSNCLCNFGWLEVFLPLPL